jgi:hypothetical protein
MPRFRSGPYLRTRRARPSEKIALRVIPGLSPQGDPRCAWPPWRGGLRTPTMRELASPGHVHPGPSVLRSPPAIMTRPGFGPARICGRTECVPPRKPSFASSPGSPRKAIRHWLAHSSEGRAPHAPMEMFSFHPGMSPLGHLSWATPPRRGGLRTPVRKASPQTTTLPRFGHGPFADPGVAMTCPGFGPARISGRGDRAPPKNLPPRYPGAFPARPSHTG